MKDQLKLTRRVLVKSALLGAVGVSIPNVLFANTARPLPIRAKPEVFHRYPSIDDELVSELVGASHFNFDRVKEIVLPRPELARACWDWGFGDWETALGAAAHVGRRDIALFLMEHGARPDIFTYAMLGSFEAVKAMIEAQPGVEQTFGPHGISLLTHAKAGLRMTDDMTTIQLENSEKLIEYLLALGTADPRQKNIAMTTEEQEKYIGDYMYGEGETEGVSIKLNSRKMLSMGKLGKFGGGLNQHKPGEFLYNGISEVVTITFQEQGGSIVSLTIQEPGLTLKAMKV